MHQLAFPEPANEQDGLDVSHFRLCEDPGDVPNGVIYRLLEPTASDIGRHAKFVSLNLDVFVQVQSGNFGCDCVLLTFFLVFF